MVSLRYEFVRLEREGCDILAHRALHDLAAHRWWLGRYARRGRRLACRAAHSLSPPGPRFKALEQAVLGIREEHPAFGEEHYTQGAAER